MCIRDRCDLIAGGKDGLENDEKGIIDECIRHIYDAYFEMCIRDSHEPIIDRETWERVQELRKQRKRPNRYDEVGFFSGILFCADCGSVCLLYTSRCV